MARQELAGHESVRKSTAPSAARIQKSSVRRSAFTPSHYELELFASVIQGFDSDHLRIHDFKTGKLYCDHKFGAGLRINSLDWGYLSAEHHHDDSDHNPRKRRKRGTDDRSSSGARHTVIALGTSSSDIQMFSPTHGKIIGKLGGLHTGGVSDFKFVQDDCAWGWSIGEDNSMAQWDMKTMQAARVITAPDSNIRVIGTSFQQPYDVFCASVTPYFLELDATSPESMSQPSVKAFGSCKQQIQAICLSEKNQRDRAEFLLVGDSDRYLDIFDISKKKLEKTLITSQGMCKLSLWTGAKGQTASPVEQQLAVLTQDGVVEIFSDPFGSSAVDQATSNIKSKRKSMTRKANAAIRLGHAASASSLVPVFDVALFDQHLVLAWAHGGIDVSFERIRWRDDGNSSLSLVGATEIVVSKKNSAFTSRLESTLQTHGPTHVDESHAVLLNGGVTEGSVSDVARMEVDDQSAGEDSLSSGEASSDQSDEDARPPARRGHTNGVSVVRSEDSDVNMTEVPQLPPAKAASEGEEEEEKSFGDLLAARADKAIAITDATTSSGGGAIVPLKSEQTLSTGSGISVSTVLTQALRTNDNNLLESCLHNNDVQIIRSTIQRIDSSLAGILIQKLAELLASRSGRFGDLLVWVQWICVAHGGAIGTQHETLSKIKLLYEVLDQRSKALNPLLLLKGKLDMLDAQMSLRKQLQASQITQEPRVGHLIYVEGEQEDSSDEDQPLGIEARISEGAGQKKPSDEMVIYEDQSDSDNGEEMPTTNGIVAADISEYDSDEEQEPYEVDQEGLVDDEADEESDGGRRDNPSGSAEEDEEDEEDDDDEEDSEMDDFIDDGLIEQMTSESELSIDKVPLEERSRKKTRSA